jgi:GntR family galactonate operon transcriptional repressor
MAMVKQRTLHSQVVQHLGLSIVREDSPSGEVLPDEAALCAQLGVSRTVLREAIKVLAAKGLVDPRPRTGTRVRPRHEWNLLDPEVLQWRYEAGPDERFLRQLMELRLIVEPPAAGMAAARATSQELDDIEMWFRRMEETLEDNPSFIDADLAFHAAILAASRNELLQQMGRTNGLALRVSRLVTGTVPGGFAVAMPMHQRIFEAIRDRDAQAAESGMRALLQRTAVDVDWALQQEGDG